MQDARKKVAAINAEKRICLALEINLPPTATYQLKEGQQALANSEKQKRWTPDLGVVLVLPEQVWVNDGKQLYKLSRAQVIP